MSKASFYPNHELKINAKDMILTIVLDMAESIVRRFPAPIPRPGDTVGLGYNSANLVELIYMGLLA
ncbi:hypothetical protein [Paenibacillus luteus]|uniref:hypothetical protein n=1 Tax=Paenibacillus luteus TaxID=2545753 RepID=UPI0011449E1A|nr:hypothetical protein [Paenibacillus luteus]